MSGDSALVERMSNAVRAAYKAMEVLKDENRALKDENEFLRKQILAVQAGAAPTLGPQRVAAAPLSNILAAQDSVVSRIGQSEPR